jgi:hypothetical protein
MKLSRKEFLKTLFGIALAPVAAVLGTKVARYSLASTGKTETVQEFYFSRWKTDPDGWTWFNRVDREQGPLYHWTPIEEKTHE